MSPDSIKGYLRSILSSRDVRVEWNIMDEVYPGVYLGGEEAARNVENLKTLGITHILNVSLSTLNAQTFGVVGTNDKFYKDRGFDGKFMGIAALDFAGFDLSIYFEDSTAFIDSALQSNGKILVHCFMGVSRSATLVLAYLMDKKGMKLEESLRLVRSKRNIFPNDGFLDQLLELEKRIQGSYV